MNKSAIKLKLRGQYCILLILLFIVAGCGGGSGVSDYGGNLNSGTEYANNPQPPEEPVETPEEPVETPEEPVESPPVEQPEERSVTLAWDAPDTNEDGSELTDLAGYKIYYGESSNNYTYSVDVGSSSGAMISSLSTGSWCFAVTAYDNAGNESTPSEEVCI